MKIIQIPINIESCLKFDRVPQRWNGKNWQAMKFIKLVKPSEYDRQERWKVLEKKKQLGKFHGPTARGHASRSKEIKYYVYPLAPGVSHLPIKGQSKHTFCAIFDNELEAAKYWDSLQRKLFDFPAPVNFPTPAEADARKKETFRNPKLIANQPIEFINDFVEYFSKVNEQEFEKLPASCQLFINSMLIKKLEKLA